MRLTPGLGGGRWSLVLLITAVMSSASSAALIYPESPGTRLDFRTVILAPARSAGKIRVTTFHAFHVPAEPRPPANMYLLLPLDGLPGAVSAEATSVSAFDRFHTHGDDLEAAFYDRARAEGEARASLFATLAANGGVPAWLLLAPRWPPRGRGITAVVEMPDAPDIPPHRVLQVGVRRVGELPQLFRSRAIRRIAETFADAEYVLVARFHPSPASPERAKHPARAGIRISYEIPVRETGRVRLPMHVASWDGPTALTRIYAVAPAGRRADLEFAAAAKRRGPAQRLVSASLSVFGVPDTFRHARGQRIKSVDVSSVTRKDGGSTTRVVATFVDFDRALNIQIDGVAGAGAPPARIAAGDAVLALLAPLTAALYLVGLWVAVHMYLWMTDFPAPAGLWRKVALLAIGGPLLTPWIALKLLTPKGPFSTERTGSGPLGVLTVSDYECLVRLILWGLLVCANWALIESVARLGLWLRYG